MFLNQFVNKTGQFERFVFFYMILFHLIVIRNLINSFFSFTVFRFK